MQIPLLMMNMGGKNKGSR